VSAESVTAEMTQDDKIMAAVGHATIIWPVLGIIAPLVIWATQREKSAFVAFQALQATVYHMTLILAGLVCGICYLFTYFGVVLGALGIPLSMVFTLSREGTRTEEIPPGAVVAMIVASLVMVFFYLLVFSLMTVGVAGWLAYMAYGLYGAVASFRGRDFRYVVIGPRLERYLRQT
jgi:uncharacterized Tic20 family protein